MQINLCDFSGDTYGGRTISQQGLNIEVLYTSIPFIMMVITYLAVSLIKHPWRFIKNTSMSTLSSHCSLWVKIINIMLDSPS